MFLYYQVTEQKLSQTQHITASQSTVPGVALAMRHRLQWFIHLRAQRLWEGGEHPTYAPEGHGRL